MADDQNQPAVQAPTPMPQQAGQAGGAQGGAQGGGLHMDAQMAEQLRSQLRPHQSLAPLRPNPKASSPSMGAQIGMNLLSMFVPFVGVAVQKSVHQQKEMEINTAMNDYSILNDELEMASMTSQGDEKKTMEQWMQSPRVQAILNDKKKRKQIAKAFSMDWMNPEKTQNSVHYQGLQRFLHINPAAKLVKMLHGVMGNRQQDQQQEPMMSNQQVGEMLPKVMTPPDPKSIEALSRIDEQRQFHADTIEERRQNRVQQLQNHMDTMEQRNSEFQARLHEGAMRREDMQQWHKMLMDGRTADRQLRAELIQMRQQDGKDANAEWAELVRQGHPITEIPVKERSGVVKYMQGQGMSVPKPIPSGEQKVLSDATETEMKIEGWLAAIDKMADPKTGKLPDGRWDLFKSGLQYYAGSNTPESAIQSDLSRERWAAISPLLHGVRRGDLLKDMVQHTPVALPTFGHPIPDSLALMKTKLERLRANFQAARLSTLMAYGYDTDPLTGKSLKEVREKLQKDGFGFNDNGDVTALPTDKQGPPPPPTGFKIQPKGK